MKYLSQELNVNAAPNKVFKSFAVAHWDASPRRGSRPLIQRYT